MTKTAKTKTQKKTSTKKAISKSKPGSSKKAEVKKALMRQSSLFYTKASAKKAPSAPKKEKATKDWEPGYKKEITMFKNQPDYFQLNAAYKDA